MTGTQMIETILDINPDAEVILIGDDYDNIQWDDTPVISLSDLEARKITMAEEYDSLEYSRAREEKYNVLNQFELISDDSINGTTTHKDAILAIKAAHPKP